MVANQFGKTVLSFQISIDEQQRFACRADQPVLLAMGGHGDNSIPVGCRSGGCGVCRVQVLSGEYECGQMSAACISPEDRRNDVVLACQLLPRSDLNLKPVGPSRVVPDDYPFKALMAAVRKQSGRGNAHE